MTENPTNRAWLLANRLGNPTEARHNEEAGVLLYYQSQLEAELAEIRRRIAELTGGAPVKA